VVGWRGEKGGEKKGQEGVVEKRKESERNRVWWAGSGI